MKVKHSLGLIATSFICSIFLSFCSTAICQTPDAEIIVPQMDSLVKEKQMAGSVTLIATKEKIIHFEATGYSELESQTAMLKSNIFLIASMTKPITAAALMILVDEGKLKVDDPVYLYIPEYENARLEQEELRRPITIKDLLTHTSGIRHLPYDASNPDPSLEQRARIMATLPLNFQPGSEWRYSSGLNIIGRIIEIVSGDSFDTFLSKRIFNPLKMPDTGFILTSEQAKRIATIYKPGQNPGEIEMAFKPDPTKSLTPNPSGGLYSTALDLARFYQAILNGGELDGVRILSEKSVKLMTQLHTGNMDTGFTAGCGYGLGCGIVREPQGVHAMLSTGTFGHGGAFGTQAWVDPSQELIFILMIQRRGFGNGDDSDIRRIFQEEAVKHFVK